MICKFSSVLLKMLNRCSLFLSFFLLIQLIVFSVKTAVKTVLIGSRSRIKNDLIIQQEGSWLFCQIFEFSGSDMHVIIYVKTMTVCVVQVTILRGKDGYGFTICSDSPVRVQAVDPGEFCIHVSVQIKLSSQNEKFAMGKEYGGLENTTCWFLTIYYKKCQTEDHKHETVPSSRVCLT